MNDINQTGMICPVSSVIENSLKRLDEKFVLTELCEKSSNTQIMPGLRELVTFAISLNIFFSLVSK